MPSLSYCYCLLLLLYLFQFFEKAAENVKENVGTDVQTDQLIREAYRNILEHVRMLHAGHVTMCSPLYSPVNLAPSPVLLHNEHY